MKKAFIFSFLLYLSLSLPCFCYATVSHQTGQSTQQTQEQAVQRQKTQTIQQTKGTSQRQAKQRGESVSEQEARREAKSVVNGVHFRVQVPVTTLLFSVATKLEEHKKHNAHKDGLFLYAAQLFTHPLTIQDITPFASSGVVDYTSQQYWQGQAAGEAVVPENQATPVVKAALQAYCYATAFKQVIQDFIRQAQNGLIEKVNKNKNTLTIAVSFEDLEKTFYILLKKELLSPDFQLEYLKTVGKFLHPQVRWHGSLNSFLLVVPGIGTCIFTLPYSLSCNSVPLLTPNQIAGISATFDVTQGWSYSQALEKLKQSQRYRSTVQAVEKYVSQLRQRGMAVQALLVERKALQLLLSGHTNLNPASLIR